MISRGSRELRRIRLAPADYHMGSRRQPRGTAMPGPPSGGRLGGTRSGGLRVVVFSGCMIRRFGWCGMAARPCHAVRPAARCPDRVHGLGVAAQHRRVATPGSPDRVGLRIAAMRPSGSSGSCRHQPDVDTGGGRTARSSGRGAVTGSGGVRSARERFRPLTPPLFFSAARLIASVLRSPPPGPRDDGHPPRAGSRRACRRRGRRPCRPGRPRRGRR